MNVKWGSHALVVLLGAVGLSAWLSWLDYVLLPLLVLFAAITVAALIQRLPRSSRHEHTST
ncbi:MAG: mercury resistance system transport protein MerF [Acidiferrobacterales bacterium]